MSKKYSWKEYDWLEIQKYHDAGHNRGEIKQKFGCAYNTIKKAENSGLFKENPLVVAKYKSQPKKWDWDLIQSNYDNGLSTRKLTEKFGISTCTIMKAANRGNLKLRNRSQAIKLNNKNNPRKLTQETKDKISRSRIAYLEQNPSQVPYLLNHYTKSIRSYPEQYFYDWLIKENIQFEEQKQVSLYCIDFYINDIALEIDGEQHYVDCKVWNKDRRRDKFLIDKGIKTIRIRWSCYQKLSLQDKIDFLINLKKDLI